MRPATRIARIQGVILPPAPRINACIGRFVIGSLPTDEHEVAKLHCESHAGVDFVSVDFAMHYFLSVILMVDAR